MGRWHPGGVLTIAGSLVVLMLSGQPLASQTCDAACNQFIASVNAAISSVAGSSGSTQPIIYGANIPYADGLVVAGASQDVLLAYVDGLKAAGVQRVEFNPGVTSLANPAVQGMYDAMVQHIHELGLELAINMEFTPGELGPNVTFQGFEAAAMASYPQLVARYQPDIFGIVHEPTTATGSMQVPINQDWRGFILTMIPLLRAASPRTKLAVGAFQNGELENLSAQEDAYFQDWAANIPGCVGAAVNTGCLDFMTMDIYNDDTFPTYIQWVTLAHANNKDVYIEELWAPHYLPNPLPAGALSAQGYLTNSLDSMAILGAADTAFVSMDLNWLQGMSKFAAANGMTALTVYTTETFFAIGTAGHDKIFDPLYNTWVISALQGGQLTSTAQGYQADVSGANPDAQAGINVATSISSASYATLAPNVFNPNCGTIQDPCNANVTVAPDALISAFGGHLATSSGITNSVTFPTTLAGTTMTLVDSSNTKYSVPLYSVSPLQVNYYVPGSVVSGPATLTINSADGVATTGAILVAPAAPGLYTANQTGKGAASGIAVCAGVCAGYPTAGSHNGQFFQYTFTCGSAPSSCVPQIFSLGAPTDTVVVELFGTGLRHLSSKSVIQAQINGQNLQVQYAGPQGGYTGLDQLNVLIPHSLAGSGLVDLILTVKDPVNNINTSFNTVTLGIQ